MRVSNSTTATWNHVNLKIENFYDDNSFSQMIIATCCMILFIGCGIWCICASCELRKGEENSYHRDKDFEKDEENPNRSKGGHDVQEV